MSGWMYRGRRALVTGASSGLGALFAEQLAARGMDLVLSARRESRLNALADRLRAEHRVGVDIIVADLAEPGAARRLWGAATAGRPIDLLINNAGFGAEGPFHEVALERHLEMLQVNCVAVTELAYLALREMRPRGMGGILNLSSIAAFQPVPLLGSYAASKAYVLHLSEALWAENREAGVRVVALCPGRTPTEFQVIAGTGSAERAFGVRSPEEVVAAGLRALERGRSHEVPGVGNLVVSWAVRSLPRSLLVRMVGGVMRRWGDRPSPVAPPATGSADEPD